MVWPETAEAVLAVFVMVSAAATMSTQLRFKIVEISFGNSLDLQPMLFEARMSAKLQYLPCKASSLTRTTRVMPPIVGARLLFCTPVTVKGPHS